VSRWLNGQAIPSQEKLQVLAEWLAVEPQALRYGEETIRAVKAKKDRWATMAPEDRDLVDALLALPVARKKIVKEVIVAFASQIK
jgi:transcriptional regulator with XRE-family HTH domain